MKIFGIVLVIIFTAVSLYAQVTDIEYPILAKYMFSGNTDDSGGLNNHSVGTELTPSIDRNGVSGRAYLLDGSRSFITTPVRINQNVNTSGVTFMIWVYPTSITDGKKYLLSTDTGKNEWSLLRDGDKWMVATGTGVYETGFSVDVNEWQFMAVAFSPTAVDVYKNTEKKTINSVGFSVADTHILIGSGHRKTSERFAGIIDEVRIYATPLKEEFIRETYQYNHPPRPSSLIGAFTFEQSLKNYSSSGKDLFMDEQPTYFAGRKNTMSGLYLNGMSQSVTLHSSINQHKNSRGFSFAAWVKPERDSKKRQFLCSTNTGNLEWSVFRNGTVWAVFNGEKQINTKLTADDGVWQFIAVVFKPGEGVFVYKNSEVEKISQIGFSKEPKFCTFFTDRKFPSEAYNGIVDDVFVFSEALSSDAIATLFKSSFEEIVKLYLSTEVYTNYKTIDLGYAFSTGLGNQSGKKGGVHFQIPLSSIKDGDALLLEKVSGNLKFITVYVEPRRGELIEIYKGTELQLPVRKYFDIYRKNPAMKNIIIMVNGVNDNYEKLEGRVKIKRKILIGEEY